MGFRLGTGYGAAVMVAAGLLMPVPARAQNNAAFGVQQRADAARQLIIVGVTQGISSLPPTSGQSFVYDYDPQLDTYKPTELLGPTSFRSPLPIGKGKVSLRVAGSYFSLNNTQNPIDYQVNGGGALQQPIPDPTFTKFGLAVNAKVGLFNIASSYGLLDWLELNLNIPISIVDAQASSSFVTATAQLNAPINDAPVAGAPTIAGLNSALRPGGPLSIRSGSVNDLGAQFNNGTSAGLGRISVGGKALFLQSQYVDMALSMEVFFPSPNADNFAGPSSFSFLPRLITAANITQAAKLHLDTGYEGDTKFDELSRFVWNAGASYAFPGVTLDSGVGGSLFNQGIQWTPTKFRQPQSPPNQNVELQFTTNGDNVTGTNYVDFLFGTKVQVAENAVLSGAVNVPLNNVGIRPVAVGTVALEMYF